MGLEVIPGSRLRRAQRRHAEQDLARAASETVDDLLDAYLQIQTALRHEVLGAEQAFDALHSTQRLYPCLQDAIRLYGPSDYFAIADAIAARADELHQQAVRLDARRLDLAVLRAQSPVNADAMRQPSAVASSISRSLEGYARRLGQIEREYRVQGYERFMR